MLARSSNSVQDTTEHNHRHHRHHHHPSSGLRGHFGIELLGGFIPAGVLGERTRRAYSESVLGLRTRTCPIGLGGNAHARNWRRFSTRTTRNFSDHEVEAFTATRSSEPGTGLGPHLFHSSVKNLLCQLGRNNPLLRTGRLPTEQECLVTRVPSLPRLTSFLRS